MFCILFIIPKSSKSSINLYFMAHLNSDANFSLENLELYLDYTEVTF